MGNMRLKTRSDTGKVFISRVVRNGFAQTQFAAKIGKAVGACVKGKTEGKSYNRGEQTKILNGCVASNGVKGYGSIGIRDTNGYYARRAEGKVGHGQPYSKPGGV